MSGALPGHGHPRKPPGHLPSPEDGPAALTASHWPPSWSLAEPDRTVGALLAHSSRSPNIRHRRLSVRPSADILDISNWRAKPKGFKYPQEIELRTSGAPKNRRSHRPPSYFRKTYLTSAYRSTLTQPPCLSYNSDWSTGPLCPIFRPAFRDREEQADGIPRGDPKRWTEGPAVCPVAQPLPQAIQPPDCGPAQTRNFARSFPPR
jgi:hypothetical protein